MKREAAQNKYQQFCSCGLPLTVTVSSPYSMHALMAIGTEVEVVTDHDSNGLFTIKLDVYMFLS